MTRLRRVAACVSVAALVLLLAGCDPLDSAELKREVDAISSAAAEGQLLASDVAQDRTKATFVRVQAGELASAADESAQKINDATVAAGIQDEADQAIELGSEVSDALGQLVTSPGDEQAGSETEAKLRDLVDKAGKLSASL
jgi:hypothetical protein